MIHCKKELKKVLNYERNTYSMKGLYGLYRWFINDENYVIWKFQSRLRKTEYYKNTNKLFFYLISLRRLNFLRNRYSLHIPLNVFDEGLKIMHLGPILVNGRVRVGKNCSIHANTAIVARGNSDEVPIVGDDVVIGFGSVLLGAIRIANGIAIGANAVVNKSYDEDNITIAGVPARKISNEGKSSWIK